MNCSNCGNLLQSFTRFCPKCGAPVQPEAAPMYSGPTYSAPQTPMGGSMGGPMGQPPKKSGCGKIILILAIILVVLGGAIAAAIYFGYQSLEKSLKSSEAYTVALNKLKENERVREELGEIKDTGFPIGAFSQNADGSGNAAFVMSVEGTKDSGKFEVHLVRSHSVWRLESGIVRTKDGDNINISDPPPTPEEDVDLNENADPDLPPAVGDGKTISGGVLNGKATSLPKPPYPSVAKAAKASGTVVVQVLIDEDGDVVTARAVSGHPLLKAAAVSAARQAKFTPTKLAGKPVKVSGVITYNFVAE